MKLAPVCAVCICANVFVAVVARTEGSIRCGPQAQVKENSEASTDENRIDGYTFLEDKRKVHLVMTSLASVFQMPDHTNIQCISSTTTEKNDINHEVLATVDYKISGSETWGKFSQRFKFIEESGHFNKMELQEESGAPTGNYSFIYASRDCGVMKVEQFVVHLTDAENEPNGNAAENPVQGAHAGVAVPDQTSTMLPDCIVWSISENTHALQKSCEPYFSACCQKKNPAYTYTPGSCNVPEERSEL